MVVGLRGESLETGAWSNGVPLDREMSTGEWPALCVGAI